jgi:hypothetical protein
VGLILIGCARLSRSYIQIKNFLNSYRAGAHSNLVTLDVSTLFSEDEAEEILLNVEVLLMSTSRVPVSSKMASMFSKKVEDTTTALTKCHVYLKRRD